MSIPRANEAKWRWFQVTIVRGARLQRACRDEHVVRLTADHSLSLCPAQRAPGIVRRQVNGRGLAPVRFQERDGVGGP